MNILHIDSSISGDASASREISAGVMARLKRSPQGDTVIYRDLAEEPIPHLTLDALADTGIVDEFLAADTVVIGAPMYNFTLASQLKSWLDRILVVGKTFRYGEAGPEGLATGKRVIVALTRGGVYSEGSPTVALEHLETYLRGVFRFIGVEPEFIVAEGLALSADSRRTAMDRALDHTDRLFA